MQVVNRIEALISKGKDEDSQNFVNMLYNLMATLHLSYSDIMSMPFPLVIRLCNEIENESKKMEKEMAKSRRKR